MLRAVVVLRAADIVALVAVRLCGGGGVVVMFCWRSVFVVDGWKAKVVLQVDCEKG